MGQNSGHCLVLADNTQIKDILWFVYTVVAVNGIRK